jgi:hypothetical protein
MKNIILSIWFGVLAILVYTLYVVNKIATLFSVNKNVSFLEFHKNNTLIQKAIANTISLFIVIMIYKLIKYLL